MRIRLLSFCLLILCHDGNTAAFRLIGSVQKSLKLTRAHTTTHTSNVSNDAKTITLQQYQLSSATQQQLVANIKQALSSPETNDNAAVVLPSNKQLGMSNVPVLDQGRHGTCTTFATTAAIDAALKKGNYISQLCLLTLGSTLSENSNTVSGWDGANNTLILKRIQEYGIMTLKKQNQYGCGGLKSYPYSTTPHTRMSLENYQKYSQSIWPNQVTWEKLNIQNKAEAISQIKMALTQGHRVVFSTLLPKTEWGTMGAVAWHHYFSDSWVLTSAIEKDIAKNSRLSGHSMIITGYDDHAVAMDSSGHRHHGLLTIRNSWGSWVADWGDFYMSYDYFKTLATSAVAIIPN